MTVIAMHTVYRARTEGEGQGREGTRWWGVSPLGVLWFGTEPRRQLAFPRTEAEELCPSAPVPLPVAILFALSREQLFVLALVPSSERGHHRRRRQRRDRCRCGRRGRVQDVQLEHVRAVDGGKQSCSEGVDGPHPG